jgi:multidrug efflux pump subunit AcrA (membrane-fusion protein)
MKNKLLYVVAVLGIAAGFVSAHIYGIEKKPLPPLFNSAPNPYSKGIYANGIVESYQSNGANINIFPEVSGFITQIYAVEGTTVHQGEPLLQIDDSVQRFNVEQQKSSSRCRPVAPARAAGAASQAGSRRIKSPVRAGDRKFKNLPRSTGQNQKII